MNSMEIRKIKKSDYRKGGEEMQSEDNDWDLQFDDVSDLLSEMIKRIKSLEEEMRRLKEKAEEN